VGAFAVQLAAILGAQVSATGRARDADYVRSLGAQAFIGSDGPLPEKASGLDVIPTTAARPSGRGPHSAESAPP
jgi:NADPH:quinone reductase-like Zn-dependent oxidoreductase